MFSLYTAILIDIPKMCFLSVPETFNELLCFIDDLCSPFNPLEVFRVFVELNGVFSTCSAMITMLTTKTVNQNEKWGRGLGCVARLEHK